MTNTGLDVEEVMQPQEWWIISIAGYGEFELFGTEFEAEEMRRHKSAYEGGIGKKWRKP